MAISLASLRRGGDTRPPRLLIYGVAGVGKTKLAADAPNPIFLQTEDGLGRIDAATFGLLRNFDAVMEALGSLYSEAHEFHSRNCIAAHRRWCKNMSMQCFSPTTASAR